VALKNTGRSNSQKEKAKKVCVTILKAWQTPRTRAALSISLTLYPYTFASELPMEGLGAMFESKGAERAAQGMVGIREAAV